MSTAAIHKRGDCVSVTVSRTFNLHLRNCIQARLDSNVSCLKLDLGRCRFLDTEAVIFLLRWMKSGRELELVDPPPILHEILEILELSEEWERLFNKQTP